MSGPELTVVVTTHDRADLIDDTLEALSTQEWDGDWEVLVVDNDSSDATPDLVEVWLDKMPVPARLVTAGERHNPSYARNTAVAASDARSVAFVDDDDIIAPGWVAAMGTALREHELVGSRAEYDHLNPPALAATTHFQSERLGRHFGVEVVASGGSGCRRDLWERVGGSREIYRNAQDTDFALRVARLGDVAPHFCADAVYHVRLRDGIGPAYRRGLRRGRAEVQLYRDHGRAFGVRPDSPLLALARWGRLALRVPSLRSAPRRLGWAEQAGRRVGRIRACLVERTWYP